ncbi:head-tail joining protein [Wolbachia endosymbiont of Oedothorax gibbosus]
MNIGKLLEDCFEHLGVEATYCNKNKESIRKIKVLIKRPDTTYSLGADGALTQQIASIEIRSEDVTSFSIGQD